MDKLYFTSDYMEGAHPAILRRLVKTYGINRSLGNVLTNEESILQAVKQHADK